MTEFEQQVEQALFSRLDRVGLNTPDGLRAAQVLAPGVAVAIRAAAEDAFPGDTLPSDWEWYVPLASLRGTP